MCYSVLFFKHPIAPKNLCGFFKRAKVTIIFVFTKNLERRSNSKEVVRLEGGAANETTIDVLLGKELLGVGGLAGTAVLDGQVVGHLGAELGLDDAADAGVDFLRLFCGRLSCKL